jgi:LuxR family maltose regulon positive regulatory protein
LGDLAAARIRPWGGAGFELFESKLRPPVVRAAIEPREALVDRLIAIPNGSVVSIVAPAGYGKSTLLAQWAERSSGRMAWLSLDARDNDPETLLVYIAAALDRVEPVEPAIFRRRSPGSLSIAPTAVLRLARAMSSMEPVTLVIDHAEALQSAQCRDVVAELAVNLPSGARLAIASRETPPIPLSRLRSRGQIAELGVPDLALDPASARGLLQRAGVALADVESEVLIERTEGWPVGLYLGALALNAGGVEATAGLAFSGDDRLVADYLRSEVLARLSRAEAEFLTRTSVLERLSGSLCDAVLGTTGSAEVLQSLEHSNLLLVALDQRHEWYRYHALFRDLLGTELARREPGAADALHLRAADWAEENGLPEMALAHAQAGHDADRATALILTLAQPTWASGRINTVLHWMEWVEAEQLVERYPAVAVHGALIYALVGHAIDAERWAIAADRTVSTEVLGDGSTMDSYRAYMRALLGREGVEAIVRDARVAWDGLNPDSPYRSTMQHTEAIGALLQGEPERADPILIGAYDAAIQVQAVPFAAMILAQRCVIAMDRDDWRAAAELSDQALAMVHGSALDDYWTSALVYAVAARVAVHRGNTTRAREDAARTARLRPLLTYALPVMSAQALIELARVYVGLGEVAGAREVLRQARDILRQRPGLGDLPDRADAVERHLESLRAEDVGATALTTAELRLLPLLQTHLTFPEIGERLHVSRHTVKTQAISIYQKLGVSSRSEAIGRMREIGLLDS